MQNIKKHFPDLTALQLAQLTQLGELYKEWNSQINVISRKDIDHVYAHHILHSLSIGLFIQFKPYTRILDIGTGGGLPGLPLAILFPKARFLLVDSIGKKIKVVQDIIERMELTNVQAKHQRGEQVDDTFDFVVCRAVAHLEKLKNWTWQHIEKGNYNDWRNGLICLKGGDVQTEVNTVKPKAKIYSLMEKLELEHYQEKYIIHLPK